MPAVPSLQNTRVSFLETELYSKRGWTINTQIQFIEQVNSITDTKQTLWYYAWDFVNLLWRVSTNSRWERSQFSSKTRKSMCYRHISFFIKSSVSKPDNSLYSTLVQIQKYLLGIFCCLTKVTLLSLSYLTCQQHDLWSSKLEMWRFWNSDSKL